MTWKSTGPLSYQGASKKVTCKDAPTLSLLVKALDHEDSLETSGRPALLHPDQYAIFAAYLQGAPAFLQLTQGSDFLSNLSTSTDVCMGTVHMEQVQRHNMHVALSETYDFSVWEGPEDPNQLDLVSVAAEIRLLPDSTVEPDSPPCPASTTDAMEAETPAPPINTDACAPLSDKFNALNLQEHTSRPTSQLDAALVVTELRRSHIGSMLTSNQLVSLTINSTCYLLRITDPNTLDNEAQDSTIGYHCFRGRLAPDTQIYLYTSTNAGDQDTIRLVNAKQPPAPGVPQNVVNVQTNDGECFPVKKALLRMCIALTAAVRSQEESVTCDVDVDTLTFDRVLIFLEALALGKEPPKYGAHLLDDLLAAGTTMRCQSLVSYCQDRLGVLKTRIRIHSWEQVVAANGRGQCWLVLDGMVLDVTNWLSEHPGGKTIIPQQALNLDCSRFFEVYHASRESFLYLKEFYIGEVETLDLEKVPRHDEPSDDFLAQLRSFTLWRIDAREVKAFKSF